MALNFLHGCNPSLKFILYICMSISLTLSSGTALITLFLLVFCSALMGGVKIGQIARQLQSFFWIFLISYLSRAHVNGGEVFILFPSSMAFPLSWNADGARAAAFFVLRICGVIILTNMLMLSTGAGELQRGIYSLLAFAHRGLAWRISIMLRIMLVSIPILKDTAAASRKRLRMRGLIARKHPLAWLRGSSLAMLRAVDRLSSAWPRALLVRAWTLHNPPPPERRALRPADIRLISIAALMLACSISI